MTLSREQALLVAGVVLGAIAMVLLSPWSPLTQKAAPQGQEGQTWGPGQPLVPYLARGGLYHPPLAGEGRTGLLAHGWEWIANPPAAVQGPGVGNA